MKLNVTAQAQKELKRLGYSHHKGLRIDAHYIGSSDDYASYKLLDGEIGFPEEAILLGELLFFVSPETKEIIGETLTLDYHPSIGYRLLTPSGTLRHNLKIKKSKVLD